MRDISYKSEGVTYERLWAKITSDLMECWKIPPGFQIRSRPRHVRVPTTRPDQTDVRRPTSDVFVRPWIKAAFLCTATLLSRKYHFISFMAITSKGDSSLLDTSHTFIGPFESRSYISARPVTLRSTFHVRPTYLLSDSTASANFRSRDRFVGACNQTPRWFQYTSKWIVCMVVIKN